MALVKYGGGIVQMSGSIAGTTHARNRFGNYARARTKPINPNSALQVAIRSSLAYLTQYWHDTLEAADRIGWATYAAAIAMKNRLGEVTYLTGFNHFLRSNIIRQVLGLTIIDAGPTTLSLPDKDSTFAIQCTEDDQFISVTFNNALAWAIAVGGYMVVYQGVPQLVTRNYFGGPWRYTGKIDGAVVPPTSPADLTAAMTLVEGQKVWAYARIIDVEGRISEPFYANSIVLDTAPV